MFFKIHKLRVCVQWYVLPPLQVSQIDNLDRCGLPQFKPNHIIADNYHFKSIDLPLKHTYAHSNLHGIVASESKILDFVSEVQASAGEQVTLRVNFTGVPKPTITWTFKGTKMEGDYATELGTDGSLLFVCVETKHSGRYS